VDASDGFFLQIFVLDSTNGSVGVEKSSKGGHPNYFSSHIFVDEQSGGIVMGKTCTSLTEMENKLFAYLRGRDHLINLGVEVQREGMEKYRGGCL
jgi:hypothetical protein